jgi:murein DD-endopeptidase MepM/ murein hydrolase activator NlpD
MKDKEVQEKRIKTKRMNKEKRFYLWTAIGSAAALIAIETVAVLASGNPVKDDNQANNAPNSSYTPPVDNNQGNQNQNPDDNQQVVVTPEGMVMPIESVSLIHDYGFYHNTTLNCYYEHTGLDFAAEVGTQVRAVEAGTVQSVYKDDLLAGTEIIIDHGDGLKSVYRFITEVEGLKAGDKVEKGQVIAPVAEANGNEYKDGAHLHFEIVKDSQAVDPTTYLTLEEK